MSARPSWARFKELAGQLNAKPFLVLSMDFDSGAKRPGCEGSGRAATHPEAPRIQHLRVAGEVHVQASIVADGHGHFL